MKYFKYPITTPISIILDNHKVFQPIMFCRVNRPFLSEIHKNFTNQNIYLEDKKDVYYLKNVGDIFMSETEKLIVSDGCGNLFFIDNVDIDEFLEVYRDILMDWKYEKYQKIDIETILLSLMI